eukprot:TRINITY_DN66640_c5_g5_i1.p1 TRINITY_DN66640_c5_g5~~TRINITY_DN66640_c5_g5_i1.p1  ORF type:complete len:714 (-),score=42.08 TRINITY_DN66640_c5_g5_i1:90-2231(-)
MFSPTQMVPVSPMCNWSIAGSPAHLTPAANYPVMYCTSGMHTSPVGGLSPFASPRVDQVGQILRRTPTTLPTELVYTPPTPAAAIHHSGTYQPTLAPRALFTSPQRNNVEQTPQPQATPQQQRTPLLRTPRSKRKQARLVEPDIAVVGPVSQSNETYTITPVKAGPKQLATKIVRDPAVDHKHSWNKDGTAGRKLRPSTTGVPERNRGSMFRRKCQNPAAGFAIYQQDGTYLIRCGCPVFCDSQHHCTCNMASMRCDGALYKRQCQHGVSLSRIKHDEVCIVQGCTTEGTHWHCNLCPAQDKNVNHMRQHFWGKHFEHIQKVYDNDALKTIAAPGAPEPVAMEVDSMNVNTFEVVETNVVTNSAHHVQVTVGVDQQRQKAKSENTKRLYWIAQNEQGHHLFAVKDLAGEHCWLCTPNGGHTFKNAMVPKQQRQRLPTDNLELCTHAECAIDLWAGSTCPHIQRCAQLLQQGGEVLRTTTFTGREDVFQASELGQSAMYGVIKETITDAIEEKLPLLAFVFATKQAFVYSKDSPFGVPYVTVSWGYRGRANAFWHCNCNHRHDLCAHTLLVACTNLIPNAPHPTAPHATDTEADASVTIDTWQQQYLETHATLWPIPQDQSPAPPLANLDVDLPTCLHCKSATRTGNYSLTIAAPDAPSSCSPDPERTGYSLLLLDLEVALVLASNLMHSAKGSNTLTPNHSNSSGEQDGFGPC